MLYLRAIPKIFFQKKTYRTKALYKQSIFTE